MQIEQHEPIIDLQIRQAREPARVADLRQNVSIDGEFEQREYHARNDVNRNTFRPFAFIKRKISSQFENKRSQQEPDHARNKLPREYSPQRNRIFGKLALQRALTGQKKSDHHPNAEYEYPGSRSFNKCRVRIHQVFILHYRQALANSISAVIL